MVCHGKRTLDLDGAGLVGGCKALDQQLRELGSKLLVVHGDAAAAIPALAHALQSRSIITEDEVEYW